jgi:hypothetical protein
MKKPLCGVEVAQIAVADILPRPDPLADGDA